LIIFIFEYKITQTMKGKDVGFFLLGAAVGAGIAWLFTSNEGKELLIKAKDIADEWKEDLDEAIAKATQGVDLENEV
jgi:gas vesicle protein